MYLAVLLIFSGILLIFFGLKAFFGVLFVGFGLYILMWIWAVRRRTSRRRKNVLEEIRKRFGEKLTEEELRWLASFAEGPVGRKFFVNIEDESSKDPTRIRIAIPISLIAILKPFLKVSSYALWKIVQKRQNVLDYEQFKLILNLLIEALDDLMSYSGDFVRIESKGTLVRISIL